jgi:hypothetical protein
MARGQDFETKVKSFKLLLEWFFTPDTIAKMLEDFFEFDLDEDDPKTEQAMILIETMQQLKRN